MLTSTVEVLWTARYDYQPGWGLMPHKHEYFQMIYFISGSGAVSIGGRDYAISAGRLVLVKPQYLHSLQAASQVKTLDIKFLVKDSRLRQMLLEAENPERENAPGVSALFDSIRREGESRRPFYRDLCNLFLAEILFIYLRTNSARDGVISDRSLERMPSGDWIVQQAAQYIREHLAQECSMTEVARAVGRSERLVRAHFKEALGLSPQRYLLQCRIQKAQELIECSNYSFKQIAGIVGFKTIHHFTRSFHEVASETPGAWRRKFQAGICKDVNIDLHFVNGSWTVPIGRVQ